MSKLRSELANFRKRLNRMAEEIEDLEQVIDDPKTTTEEDNQADIVNLTEMAALLGVSLSTLRRDIKKGLLTPYRMGSRQYFLKSDIPNILRNNNTAQK